jgi:L-ribulose-5-phosphate 3-epimerase
MASDRLGFMQGRLSPLVNGKIQAFPAEHWRDEYPAAEDLGLALMEWTLDHDGLDANPLMTAAGRAEIRALGTRHGVSVETITGDLFMQRPFWKAGGAERDARLADFDRVVDAAVDAGVRIVVVPLVDNGSVETGGEEPLLDALLAREDALRSRGLTIAFESDFPPARLASFIARFPAGVFGVNYDTGNSAALGFDCGDEIAAYADRIVNVHIKDRVRGGTTVPLGTGAADLPRAMKRLRASGYRGRYILQTARAADGEHAGALARYRNMVRAWLAEPRT